MQPHLTHCVFVCDMINLLLTESYSLFIVDVCLFKIIHCFDITIMRQHTIFIELFETVNLYTSRLLIRDTFLRLSTSASSSLILKTLSSTLWRWGKTNTSITVFQHFLHLPCPCTYELIK